MSAVLFATEPTIVHGLGNELPFRSEWLGIVRGDDVGSVGNPDARLWLVLAGDEVGVCYIAQVGGVEGASSPLTTGQTTGSATWLAVVGVGSAPWSDRGTRPVFPPGEPMPPFAGVREPRRPLHPAPTDSIAIAVPA